MKRYYIKIGKFYLQGLSTDEGCVSTDFISSIDLMSYTDHIYTVVNESDIEFYREKLAKVLGLDVMSKNIITFEEIKEED